ncbi:uncharacterized protein LOC116430898 isoform X2 [Nomia melanderi]|nr:uncharacterized protein LOC116430898 isoform X2 [Nomia melanderi]
MCKKEIPQNLWSTFCETLNPMKHYTKFHEIYDYNMWMALYKLWTKFRNIPEWKPGTECIEPLKIQSHTEHITCLEISENIMAAGSSEGYVYFYDVCDISKTPFFVADNVEYIQNVQFIRDDACVLCVTRSINNHISIWDLRTKKLINKTVGELICTSYSYFYNAVRNMVIIEGTVIEGTIVRTVYELNTTEVIALGADNNKVHLYTRERFIHLHLTPENKKYITYTLAEIPNIRVHHFYIFKPDVVICIAGYGYLGFLIKGKKWEMHNLFPILHCTPTAVFLYGRILFVGADTGSVYIYHIKDFAAINFSTIHFKQLTLEHTAVVSVNILVNIETYLVVTFRRKIHILQLT